MKASHPFQLKGKNSRFIHSTLWMNEKNVSKTAVLLPGFEYGCEAPVFYFLRLLLAEKGYNVLTVDCRYNENFHYLQMSGTDRLLYFNEEQTLIAEQLASVLNYEEYVFAAKSEGTSALIEMIFSGIISGIIEKSRLIWMTPAQRNAEIVEYIRESFQPSLYIACENDGFFNAELIESLYDHSGTECMIVPEADVLFGKKDDTTASIDNVKSVLSFIDSNF
ncbi:MAG: hypothetical protein JW982_02180 [Spirochaetes bacterium]|nr:hypothetical protein [Spirochaetota bacterium]